MVGAGIFNMKSDRLENCLNYNVIPTKMKIRLFVCAVLISLCAQGQSSMYHPFPDSVAYWREREVSVIWTPSPCTVNDDYVLFINGDTLIGVNTYHKLYSSGFMSASCPPPGFSYFNEYRGAFRQDTILRRVYYVPVSAANDTLLYDFNLNLGDTLPMTYNYGTGNVVIGIDSVLVGTSYHKRYLLSPLFQPSGADTSYALIEGIGSTFGFYWSIQPFFEGGSFLNCFRNNGQDYPWNSNCEFDVRIGENGGEQSETNIYPNPMLYQATFKSQPILESATLTIYNSLGQVVRVMGNLSGQTVVITRDELTAGLYYFQVVDKDGLVTTGSLVIAP